MDQELLDFAVDVVRQAFALIMVRFREGTTWTLKADGSQVTPADIEVEQLVRALIAERFPDDGVFGEEESPKAGTTGRRWIIDPINGTTAFLRHNPTFNTLLAVEDEHGPAIGVVGYPAADQMLYAGRGLGCWHRIGDREPVRAAVSDSKRERGYRISASNITTWSDELLLALHRETYMYPDDGLLQLVTGDTEAHVVAGMPMGYEDLAPYPVIVSEAGGRVTDLHGNDLLSGDMSVLASNGLLHDRVLALVRDISHGRDYHALRA